MTIYEELKNDHKNVKHLLEQLVKCSKNDDVQWKTLVDKIRDELIPHVRAEEAVFYNAIREMGNDASEFQVVGHAYAEHATAEAELRTLQAMKEIDVNWTALATKLKNDVIHHAEEEESKVFAAAKKLFTDEEAKMIGKAFVALKPAIKKQSLMETTLDLVANLLPRKFSQNFLKSMSDEQKKAG